MASLADKTAKVLSGHSNEELYEIITSVLSTRLEVLQEVVEWAADAFDITSIRDDIEECSNSQGMIEEDSIGSAGSKRLRRRGPRSIEAQERRAAQYSRKFHQEEEITFDNSEAQGLMDSAEPEEIHPESEAPQPSTTASGCPGKKPSGMGRLVKPQRAQLASTEAAKDQAASPPPLGKRPSGMGAWAKPPDAASQQASGTAGGKRPSRMGTLAKPVGASSNGEKVAPTTVKKPTGMGAWAKPPSSDTSNRGVSDEKGRFQGRLKSFNEVNGFGFIECQETFDQYGLDVYVHKNEVGNVAVGDAVVFGIHLNKDGKPQANGVAPHMVGRKRPWTS